LTRESEDGEGTGRTGFEAEGETWTVSGVGGGRSGTGSDVGASLLLLRFSPGTSDRPAREVLVPASTLDELGEDGLRDAFERAKPRPSSGKAGPEDLGPASTDPDAADPDAVRPESATDAPLGEAADDPSGAPIDGYSVSD
jgi:hypothetical protein